jgi:hypothetical protein
MWTTVARTKRHGGRKIPTLTSFVSAPPLLTSEFGAFRHGFFYSVTRSFPFSYLSPCSHIRFLTPHQYKLHLWPPRLGLTASISQGLTHITELLVGVWYLNNDEKKFNLFNSLDNFLYPIFFYISHFNCLVDLMIMVFPSTMGHWFGAYP